MSGVYTPLAALRMPKVREIQSYTLEYCAVLASCRRICASLVWVSFESLGRLLSASPLGASTAVTTSIYQSPLRRLPRVRDIL